MAHGHWPISRLDGKDDKTGGMYKKYTNQDRSDKMEKMEWDEALPTFKGQEPVVLTILKSCQVDSSIYVVWFVYEVWRNRENRENVCITAVLTANTASYITCHVTLLKGLGTHAQVHKKVSNWLYLLWRLGGVK